MLYSERDYSLLFHFLKVGIKQAKTDLSCIYTVQQQEWERLFSLSTLHEVGALLADGFLMNESIDIPIDVRLKYVGIQEMSEQSYRHHRNVLSELLTLFSEKGIPTMVIKGFSLAQYYPFPSHRKCGDIDIYQFGHQPQSDQWVSELCGLEIRQYTVSHHTNYCYKGISVENHFQFVTTYYKGNSVELESLLENEAKNAVQASIPIPNVFFPSATLNAIFLTCHMAGHFREDRVTLRQILDWMLFLQKEYENVDWAFVQKVYNYYHLTEFVNAINGILIRLLDMPQHFAYKYVKNEQLEKKILKDTLMISNRNQREKELFYNVRQEWHQYITSGWKYRLFNLCGTLKMIEKLWLYLRFPNDFKEKIIYYPTISK